MTNRNFQDNAPEESQNFGVWIKYKPDTILEKTMKKLRQIRNTILLGLGIALGMVIIWLMLFVTNVGANGPDSDTPIPFLENKSTAMLGTNPDYYPTYQDTIYLITSVPHWEYSFGTENVTGCYQLIWKQLYGTEYATNVGYKIIYDVQGLSAPVANLENISTCHGSKIYNVSYVKLASGIHQ